MLPPYSGPTLFEMSHLSPSASLASQKISFFVQISRNRIGKCLIKLQLLQWECVWGSWISWTLTFWSKTTCLLCAVNEPGNWTYHSFVPSIRICFCSQICQWRHIYIYIDVSPILQWLKVNTTPKRLYCIVLAISGLELDYINSHMIWTSNRIDIDRIITMIIIIIIIIMLKRWRSIFESIGAVSHTSTHEHSSIVA